MKRIAAILTLTILSIGCVSQKTQHHNMNSVKEFLERHDKSFTTNSGKSYVYPEDHYKWDRDILRRLNDRELLLNQQ
jgi:hypothetical protein